MMSNVRDIWKIDHLNEIHQLWHGCGPSTPNETIVSENRPIAMMASKYYAEKAK